MRQWVAGRSPRTKRLPLQKRAAAAVIARMRHRTTGYDGMAIPRVKGERREVYPDHAPFLEQLRRDIELDREELEGLMAKLGITQSSVRQAAAWVAEKLARLKLKVDDLSSSKLKLLESLEVVAIGIHGKGSLWRALKVVPAASGPDYDKLTRRADEQRERIEAVRLEAARAAFGS